MTPNDYSAVAPPRTLETHDLPLARGKNRVKGATPFVTASTPW
ncbi:MAG: hypothetical protein ACTSU5_17475 [Promethearchaeota archaeon]